MPRRNATGVVKLTVAALILAQSLFLRAQDAPEYKPADQIKGAIRVCGSPQMGDLLKLYQQAFARVQPGVRFENDLESTLTAASGVASGKAEIGLLGREIWPQEAAAFAVVRGRAPLVLDIATGSYDVPKATFALMVFVPSANPMASVSLEQLERIFTASDHPIRTWGELGLKGDWAARPIHLYGFTVDNDKSQIFRQLAFRGGEGWSAKMTTFGNEGGTDAGELILRAVAGDPDAIGISNVHYATAAVKALAIAQGNGVAPVAPTRENVASRRYPLTRAVYMVADAGPGRPLSPVVREFLRYVLSREGQRDVAREGNYLPLPERIAEDERRRLAGR